MSRADRHSGSQDHRALLYSHDTFGLGHLRRSRTIASALIGAEATDSALIVTGSPIAGRFDFHERIDHVRLPGVVKLPDGSYTSSALRMDIDNMVSLRAAIIEAAEQEFAPDLLIVDKEPWGFREELAVTLEKARRRGTRIVLGVRDVLDEEDALLAEWERKGAVDAIERFYDEIWIYGIPEMCRPLSGLGLSRRMEERIVYTGYLRREVGEGLAESGAEVPDHPFVLVTTGGGGDGVELVDWVLRAYESDPKLEPRALIVYGPFMGANHRAEFTQRVIALGDRVAATSFHPKMEALLSGATGIVAMGGYNTFCEILSMDKPAIISPRTQPRQEQLIRAVSSERLGMTRMLTSERDGTSAAVMAGAIRALQDQAPPSSVSIPGLLSGLDRIAERARGGLVASPLAMTGG
ncbi:MAG: glycosyltransferase [Pseudomonadota bacterium]